MQKAGPFPTRETEHVHSVRLQAYLKYLATSSRPTEHAAKYQISRQNDSPTASEKAPKRKKTFSNCVFHTVDSTYEFTVLSARTGVAKCPPYLYKKNLLFSIEFCRRRDSNPGPTGFELLTLPTELSERCLKMSIYLGLFIYHRRNIFGRGGRGHS